MTVKVQFNPSTLKVGYNASIDKAQTVDTFCGSTYSSYDCSCFAAGKTPLKVIVELNGVQIKDANVPTWANNEIYTAGFPGWELVTWPDGVYAPAVGVIISGTQYQVKETHISGASIAWSYSSSDYVIGTRVYQGVQNNNTYKCLIKHKSYPQAWKEGATDG